MRLQELNEKLLWEDDDIFVVAEGSTDLRLAVKGKPGRFIKDVEALAKKGLDKPGIIGSYALDQTKRYKGFKGHMRRTIAFYARNVQERKAYEKLIKQLTRSGQYKMVRSFPYSGGGRVFELSPKR